MKRVLSFLIGGTLAASCASAPPPPKQARENTAIAPATPAPAPAPQPAPVQAPVTPPDPWAGRTDLLAPPAMVLDTKVDLGTVERYKLPNGAQVILVPRKSAPVINVIVGFRSGRLSEPVERAGLANFTAAMLRKGTAKRTADQISRALDSRGVNVGAGASTDLMSVRCSGRASELALCLDNTADLVLRPSFPDKELAEVRTQMLAGIAARRDAPSSIADMHWRNQLFGEDDPRGRSPSQMSLAAIDRETMQHFYDANFDPSRAVIAVSGDFDAAATRKRIAALFGAWKPKSATAPKTPTMPVPIGLSLRVVDKPEATQAAIVLAGPAIDSRSPDYPAVTLMNYIFGGGGFSSRLMQTVRSQGGKTYGVRSRFDVMRTGGVFVIATSTRTEEVGATLQLIDGELAKIRKGGVTQEELDKAKANLIGGYGLGLETAADVSDALLSAELDGQGPAFVTEWPARLQRVTTDDVQRVAEKYLRPAVLTVAGNRMGFVAQLGKIPWLDKIPTETLSFTEPVSARERAAAEHGPATHSPPATIPATVDIPAMKLLEAAYQHAGGAKLEKVKKLVLSGKGQMNVNGKSIAVQAVETYTPPDALRMEMTIGAQTMVQVLERDRGYLESGKRHQDLPAEMLAEMRRAYWRDPHFVLANARRGGTTLAMGAPEKLDGRELQTVIATAANGDVVKLLVDAKTSELVEIRYTEEGKPGTDRMTDYRVVEGTGIRAPFHLVRHGAGGDLLDITYEKIAIE